MLETRCWKELEGRKGVDRNCWSPIPLHLDSESLGRFKEAEEGVLSRSSRELAEAAGRTKVERWDSSQS